MIPLALIIAALEFGTQALRAFNGLEIDQRKEIIRRLLEDDESRRKWWADVEAWFGAHLPKLK